MQYIDVKIVRIYTLEGAKVIPQIMHYLQHEVKVRGASIFRAISGFGEHGTHSSSILDWSIALPVVIEFYDNVDKIDEIVDYLVTIVKKEHIIVLDAKSL